MTVPSEVAEGYMKQISEITGREYHLFNYTGAPDAELVLVAMGSGAQTIEETVKLLVEKGEKSRLHQRSHVPSLVGKTLLGSRSRYR